MEFKVFHSIFVCTLLMSFKLLKAKDLSSLIFFPDEVPDVNPVKSPSSESNNGADLIDVKIRQFGKNETTLLFQPIEDKPIMFESPANQNPLNFPINNSSQKMKGPIAFGDVDEDRLFVEEELAIHEELIDGENDNFKSIKDNSGCEGEAYIFENKTEKCRELLAQNDCQPNEWLTIKNDTLQCSIRPCKPGYLILNNNCTSIADSDICGAGKSLYATETGEGICDCAYYFAYWPKDKKCYHIGLKGPCKQDHIILINKDTRLAECKFNPCGERKVLYNNTCYELESPGPCETGILNYNIEGKLECLSVSLHVLIKTPLMVKCRPGTIMDKNGNCRETFYLF